MSSSDPLYDLTVSDQYLVVALTPRLKDAPWDGKVEQSYQEILEQVRPRTRPALVVDLSALDYLGSTAVAVLMRIWRAVSERNGRMVIVNRHELVGEVLRIAGLDRIWTIVETRDEALVALGVAPGSRHPVERWLLPIGVAALLAGGVGLYLLWERTIGVSGPAALGMALAGAGVALLLGACGAVRERGLWQAASVVIALGGLGIGAASVFMLPGGDVPAEAPLVAPTPQPESET